MTLRISNIEISRFRGISQKLVIDFHARGSGKPVSLIMAGDNGVGKSSIVDAFEYALLGRINLQNLTRQFSPLSMSTKSIQEYYIRVNFSDKSSITRAVSEYQKEIFQEEYLYRNQSGKHITNRDPHPNIAISPFILRRADILRFWTKREKTRKTIFSNYLHRIGAIDPQNLSTTKPIQSPNIKDIRDVFRSASSNLTEAFLRISPSRSFVESIEIIQSPKKSASLSFRVNLSNGMSAHPSHVFSEANLDLLAFLIFLEFVKESAHRGQTKFLILDDVLQSVDAPFEFF